jgi:hypothetical protein
VNAGDTILIPLPGTSYDSHLWMVISDPAIGEHCVIVNFTTWRADKDQSCVVDVGEHPYISKRTCVNYHDAKKVSISDLDRLVASQRLKPLAPLSPTLLAKIRKGVPNSRMNWDCVGLLADQGLVSTD